MTDASVHEALLAARASYGRLVAWLARQWRDIAAAEDALADAFAAALEHWPGRGVPASPEGWLLATAKRRLVDAARRSRRADDPAFRAVLESDEAVHEPPAVPDERLRLLFVCAHPAIDPNVRTALMLQTVLGVDAARIAGAFLVSPEAMAKRLVRAKAKIKATGIRFEWPDEADLPERLSFVLEAIYGAWVLDGPEGDGLLAEEAIHLAELVATGVPDEAEAPGLAALLSFSAARRTARLDDRGGFVPLDRQDPARWDRRRIERGSRWLAQAAALQAPGPFQLEAAIQAAHCHRLHTGVTPWNEIVQLYDALLALAPTAGARLGHAIAVAEASRDGERGLALLDAIEAGGALAIHQPWWAARAHLLTLAGRHGDAAAAFTRAASLCADLPMRRWLQERAAAMVAATEAAAPGNLP